MKKIPLVNRRREIIAYALVDDEDFVWLNMHSWSRHCKGYAVTNLPELGRRVTRMMHRMIMSYPDGQVDHINRSKLDNRRKNLRVVTHTQNLRNCKTNARCASGFVGVSFHRLAGKWRARARVNGKEMHLGLFTSAEEAARAYDKKAIEVYGPEFAYTNKQRGLL